MKLIDQASQRIAERLTWCTASRDQAGIAKDLAEGKDISEVYGLAKPGFSMSSSASLKNWES